MKNLLNLKRTVWKQSIITQSRRSNDGRTTVERRSRLMSIICLFLLLTLGVGQMWADNTRVVGVAATNASNGAVIVKANIGDNGTWWEYTITSNKAGITFEGKKLYIGTMNEKYGGVDALKISVNGTDKQPYSSWTTSNTFQNRIFNYDAANGAKYSDVSMTNGARVYFDASTWSQTGIKLVTGHANHQKYYSMSAITNTKLYYGTNTDSWSDAMGFGIVGGTDRSGTQDQWLTDVSAHAKEYTGWKNYGLTSTGTNQAYLVVPSGKAGEQPTINYYSTAYSSLNSIQTVKYALSTNGGTPAEMKSGTTPGKITMSSYKFVSGTYNSVTSESPTALSAGGTTYSATFTAARTATTTLTVSNVVTGYEFVGWYTDATGGTQLSSSKTYTYYPTAATTVYARFSEKTFTVTMANDGHGTTTPASSGTFGQITGGSVSATPSTGYTFATWTLTSGSGSFTSSLTTNSNKFKPTEASTLTASFNAKTYSITLDGNEGSDGSATATYNSSTLTSFNGSSRASYDLKGYYTATSGGTKVINADGTLVASAGSYTNSSSQWIYDNNVELHAQWTYNPVTYSVTYAVGTGYTSFGSLSAKNTSTSAAIASGSSLESGTGVTFTATPNTGYVVEGWYTNPACTSGKHDEGSNTYSTTLSGNITVYVKFVEKTWSVAFAAGTGGSVTTPAATPQTVGQVSGISIAATPATGYTFNRWTSSDGGSFTSAVTTNSNTFKPTADATVTASFNETMHTITIVGGTTASTTAGVATTGSATAEAPAAGKKFTGWTLGDGVTLSGGALTDRTINFTATANSSVTANYADRAQVKMYFAKPTISGWTNAYAYVWKSSDASKKNKAYPGVQLVSTEVINYVTYYIYQYYTEPDGIGGAADGSSEWNSVVFNNGQSGDNEKKTGNLTVSNGHYYVRSSAGTGKTAALTSAWCIIGTWNSWSEDADQITHSSATAGSKSISLTTGNKEFKIYNIVNETWWRFSGDVTASKAATAMNNADGNMKLTPSVAGPYTFTLGGLSGTPTLAITYPTSYTVTYKAESFYNGGASHSTATTGGTVSAVDGSDAVVTSGSKVISGSTVIITASKKEGYTFDGFFTNAACTTAVSGAGVSISDNKLTFSSISGDKTAYAKFSEVMTTVNLSATNGKIQYWTGSAWADAPSSKSVGVHTTCSLKVVPNAGYYFSGWTRSETPDFHLNGYAEANTNVTLTGDGAGTVGTLTANFVELDKIYFRNIFDDGAGNVSRWSDVYVHFDIDWADYSGQQAVKTSANNTAKGLHAAMTQIGSSDVYWAYVPRYITANSKTKVAFADHEDTYDDSYLWEGQASGRGDYSPLLNMFVPYHSAKKTGVNGVDYYDNGYWMKYDTRASQGAGYYLKVYNNRNDYTQKGEFIANTDDATIIQYQVRIDNVAADHTRFMITSAGGLNYLAAATPTSTANSDIDLNEDTRAVADNDVYFQLTATSEGFYTFILDQTGDKMKLTVDYPVSPGDYRLKHTYAGRNKANTADSTYITYSDVIKASTAAAAKTYSMYLNTGGEETLVLQKCERINSTTKLPEWSEGDATNLDGILSKLGTGGNGVYQFDITVNTSSHQVSEAANIGKYTGNYYIKTDVGPGGWADYTKNAMDKNTVNPSASFDYSYCKWVGNTSTNVKCIIANDYCNELSDTLYSDAILTRNGKAYETLPEAASVRFSYNSTTNELKRTYLRGSTLSENFVTLVPNAADYVYSAETSGTDYYSSNPKFADNGNWTYQMDAWVYPGAKGGVQTSYPGADPVTTQILVPKDNDLMGGTKPDESPTRYHVRLVYDFKTDYLMAAWLPGSKVNQSIVLNSDFMLVRKGQTSADQISFATGQSITEAKRAYGVFQFSKDDMVGHMDSWDATSYGLCMYYFSFPFDVKVSDIFGVGEMGTDWRIQKYNGAKRAQIGWFAETETFWEDLTADSVMHAYEGYSLLLNRINFNNGSNSVWTNIGDGGSVYLYFPSKDPINTLSSNTVKVKVPSHESKIDRYFTQDLNSDGTPKADARNHKFTDSHWNMVGAPLFENKNADGLEECTIESTSLKYIYAWNSSDNTLSAKALLSGSHTFQSMYAYLVQYSGTITFTGASVPASVAARQKKETKHNIIELELAKGETFSGRTYVELSENAEDGFMLNEDMYMLRNSRTADIYSFAGSYDVAANVMSVNNHMVPVGVNVKSAGTYTFSMPSNFDGTVTLIDNFTQTRTNLAIEDYEVSLPKGEINDRFLLEINIRQVPTAIDGVEGGSLKDGKAHKFIENGAMYILRDGKIYDARGNKVK